MVTESQLGSAVDATIRRMIKQTMQNIDDVLSGVDFKGTTYYGTSPANAICGDSGGILSANEHILTKRKKEEQPCAPTTPHICLSYTLRRPNF